MEWVWTVILLMTAIVLVRFLRKNSKKQLNYFEQMGVPQFKPSISDKLAVLSRKRSFFEQMKWLYSRFPEARYFCTHSLIGNVIVLRDPELIKQVTVKNFENFTDHVSFSFSDLDPLFSNNLFALKGLKWRESRIVLSPTFSLAKLKGMYSLVNRCAVNLKEYVLSLHGISSDQVTLINTKDMFARYMNDAIASVAFGMSTNSLKDRNDEFFKSGSKVIPFTPLQTLMILAYRTAPKLAKFLKLRILKREISDYFISIIDSNIKTREREGITRPDVIQFMMQARDDPRIKVRMNTVDMTANAFMFLVAGFEGSSLGVCYTAHLLAAHPEVQEKLFEGIKERYGVLCNDTIGYSCLKDFHYLTAVVYEGLRLFPSTVMLDRLCTKRTELPPSVSGGKPVVVEPGTRFWIPTVGIQHDPKNYEEPEKFIPERFLDADGVVNTKLIDSTLFLSFGKGPRMCLGFRFSIMKIKLVIVHLLAACELLPSAKTPDPIVFDKKSLSVVPESGFWLNVKLRKDGL